MSRFGQKWAVWALAGLATWACTAPEGGSLGIRVWFPFSVQEIPPETESIRVLARREVQMLGQLNLTRISPKGKLRTLPGGDIDVLALALDAFCRPVATGKTTAHIVPLVTSSAEIHLGPVDSTVAQYVQARLNPPCATPAPSVSATASGQPLPPGSTSSAPPVSNYSPTPAPSGSPQVQGQVTVTDGNDLTANPVGAPYP